MNPCFRNMLFLWITVKFKLLELCVCTLWLLFSNCYCVLIAVLCFSLKFAMFKHITNCLTLISYLEVNLWCYRICTRKSLHRKNTIENSTSDDFSIMQLFSHYNNIMIFMNNTYRNLMCWKSSGSSYNSWGKGTFLTNHSFAFGPQNNPEPHLGITILRFSFTNCAAQQLNDRKRPFHCHPESLDRCPIDNSVFTISAPSAFPSLATFRLLNHKPLS